MSKPAVSNVDVFMFFRDVPPGDRYVVYASGANSNFITTMIVEFATACLLVITIAAFKLAE